MNAVDSNDNLSSNLSDGEFYDVAIVGGGPGGSTVATLLAQHGLRVAVFEKEPFPRFHVGESLLPANLPIFDRLGCHDAIRQLGVMHKPGVILYDGFEGRGRVTFPFPSTPFQPGSAYQVVRAPFDDLLLHHAAANGACVYRQHTVKRAQFEPQRVVLDIETPRAALVTIEAQVVVDASGRSVFLGTKLGTREALPNLGKVALFSHYTGMPRSGDLSEGNARITLVPQGWLWWFSFADGSDSVGCVLHADVVKARSGSLEDMYDEVLAGWTDLVAHLALAQRVTPVHTAANFSYRMIPGTGDRYLAVGDAVGFIDPIFSTGVFIAMRSGELAVEAILKAFNSQSFGEETFRVYTRHMRRGIAPFLPFIERFYEPAFLDILFTQKPRLHLERPVLWVLSGAAFDHRPVWLRLGLALFFGIIRVRQFVRWAIALPTTSRAPW